MDISVVIPVFNEAENLSKLSVELNRVLQSMNKSYELIFVNDGSKDKSLSIIKSLAVENKAVKYVDLSKNFGHQIAVFAGLNKASGNAIVIIDADLQDPPKLIADLYTKLQEGFDVVYAKRKERKGESWHKKLTAKYFYRAMSYLSDVEIPLDTGDFRIISKRVKDIIISLPETNKFIRGQIAWTGFNQTYIEYERQERFAGKTNYSYAKMFHFAWDGITSFSVTPLRLATILGFIVSLLAFFVICYTLYQKYINGNVVPGWSSIMISILFLGGVQLICLGIIGEYIGRILENVKNRPKYIIQDTNIDDKA
ncbi:MAG: glycosyltransferase family 2 protein [Chitinophagales bacterium]|nr:glycosyltransferase family 2 protein [Chitinophagales bacterium]